MKVCIFGAGAVGAHIAARMAAANAAEVSVVARGPNLEAIRKNGILLISGKEEVRGKPAAVTDDSSSLPKQDVVIVSLKGHAVPPLAGEIERLLAPQGCAVFMLNGLPWWWNQGRGEGGALPLLDPEGALWANLREKTLGCVLYSPNEITRPGVVEHIGGNRFVIGEPSGQKTQRLQAVVDVFCKSNLPAVIAEDIRAEVWRKLMGNAAGNTIAALTRRGHFEMATDPDLKPVTMAIMRETLNVAAALGWDLRGEVDVEQSASRATPGRNSTPSMLQDVLLGRPVEVEAHIGQTQAFAREKGVPVPTIDVLLALLRALDRSQRDLTK